MSLETAAFQPCVVIPCYNHGSLIENVLVRLAPFALPCFIIDDGSDAPTRATLDALVQRYPSLTLVRLPRNAGKGVAVIEGLRHVAAQGYTHAVQVDADGQHAVEDIPAFLALARQHPDALISGHPVYDDSMPRARRYGRWITHVWVWIETLSLSLKDSMCGFRVYPVAATLAQAQRHMPGKRMDFDTEIMVRLYWQGHPSYFIPTRVTYPHDGISHFDALRDNCRISWMHTRLFFGMLPRAPGLLWRRRQQHWARQQERKGLLGMRIMIAVWRLLGRRAFSALLRLVIAVYWLTATEARQASRQWISRVRYTLALRQQPVPERLSSYRHFLRFGETMLDKVASWRGEFRPGHEVIISPEAQAAIAARPQQGRLLLASHLGDVEACRALAERHGDIVINALVFSENAQRFKQIMEEAAPDAGVNLIPVTDIGPDTAMLLKDKLDRGEWVAIVGDRIAVNPQRGGQWRVIWSTFLGQPAPFPQGPFILAAALRCPVDVVFALHLREKLHLFLEPFANPLTLPRVQRQQALQDAVDRYAARLEYYALQSPLEWFNFYDFWRLPDATVATGERNEES
ncbi:glycosyltransferase [Cronobacter dublinensis]|uniref:glycosyltransferase family 2 protein n=1 Tax=Cronobacter dublinensis TaxID=413497 RepID=UPI0024AF62AF|nr:glycosyltransferase family 2 protein [Cronobacter dublinensis]MDI7397339.1 glycosyltransferase [Cronobacter dublinensis]